jgi:hypothetical protein
MRTIFIALIFLFTFPVCGKDQTPFELENLMNKLNQKLNAQDKCSHKNLQDLVVLGNQIYVWGKFYNSLERLNIQNGEVMNVEDKARVDADSQITFNDIVNALEIWYHDNCTRHPPFRGLTSEGK